MDKLKIESKLAHSEQKPAGTQRPARTLENLACQQELLRRVSGGTDGYYGTVGPRYSWGH